MELSVTLTPVISIPSEFTTAVDSCSGPYISEQAVATAAIAMYDNTLFISLHCFELFILGQNGSGIIKSEQRHLIVAGVISYTIAFVDSEYTR